MKLLAENDTTLVNELFEALTSMGSNGLEELLRIALNQIVVSERNERGYCKAC